MNIAFCLDDNYVMPYLVCMTSIFENNKNEQIDIYLITTGLKDENLDKFNKLADIYQQHVFIKLISSDLYDNLPFDKTYSYATYNRFMIPKVVNVSKILYLDGDLIVRKSLYELWKTDISDYACAVVEDQVCDDIIHHNRLEIDTPYYNSGVQLINVDYWRQNGISELLISYLHKNPEKCVYMDQDAANAELGDKVMFLDYTYNFQEQWFNSTDKYKMHFSKWDSILSAQKDPVVVHFCSKIKPWYKECINPYKSEFVRYANMYDFVGYKEKRFHTTAYRLVYPFFYFFSGILSCLK